MYRIIDSRATGKTSRLMLLAKELGAKIACMNPHLMIENAYRYGITGIDFISYSDLLTQEKGKRDSILIDELECFTRYALGTNALMGYTLSIEDDKNVRI